jgi:hypothetical protein
MPEHGSERVHTRLRDHQPLWVLAGGDGTLLCARHAQAGLVLLSWTTREELERGVAELFGRAPRLFETHSPEQRTFGGLIETAARLGMALRIDDFVVEGLEVAPAAGG